MIELQNIKKSFGDNEVLKGVSLTFETGSMNLIIGASGSGKTTIAKCMVGLHSPDSGKVLFDGRDFHNLNFKEQKNIRKDIGFLFQGSALFDSMTVEENVSFPLQMFSSLSKNEVKERAQMYLEKVGLSHALKLYPSELSGGMMKRVGIARAISAGPKYLFCDEPNSGLDPQTSVVIDELISSLTKEFNITTIIITHDMNSVMSIGQNVFFIHKGNLLWKGSSKEILTTKEKELTDFVYASSFLKEVKNQIISK